MPGVTINFSLRVRKLLTFLMSMSVREFIFLRTLKIVGAQCRVFPDDIELRFLYSMGMFDARRFEIQFSKRRKLWLVISLNAHFRMVSPSL